MLLLEAILLAGVRPLIKPMMKEQSLFWLSDIIILPPIFSIMRLCISNTGKSSSKLYVCDSKTFMKLLLQKAKNSYPLKSSVLWSVMIKKITFLNQWSIKLSWSQFWIPAFLQMMKLLKRFNVNNWNHSKYKKY